MTLRDTNRFALTALVDHGLRSPRRRPGDASNQKGTDKDTWRVDTLTSFSV